jgi:glycosyltransferase involved in cell wall biosynthesis
MIEDLKPLVSIIMPMKNAKQWIEETLKSVRAQTFENWELIIVNDNSVDESNQVVEQFTNHKIKLFQNEGNGIINALKLALSKSEGAYITRMDADDIMPTHKLEKLYSIASKSKRIVATGQVKYFGDQPISTGYLAYENWLNQRCDQIDHWLWIYRECVIASANWMTHKSNVDFSEATYPEDYDLVFDWYEKELIIEAVNEVTHLWREHALRTSRISHNYQQKAFFNLKINRFVELDYDSKKQVVLLGKNQKTKLVSNILNAHKLKSEVLEKGLNIDSDKLNNSSVLICVYPDLKNRLEIESLLNSKGLKFAEHFWYV